MLEKLRNRVWTTTNLDKMFPGLMKKRFLKAKLSKLRNYDGIVLSPDLRNRILLMTACLAVISLLCYCHSLNSSAASTSHFATGVCQDRYVYIYPVPREFNEQLLSECHLMKGSLNMCATLSNAGLGTAIPDDQTDIFPRTGWFKTFQFALEVIFHNRIKQYDCLTQDPTKAAAIFVPYYAGLEAHRTLKENDLALRDASPRKLEEWLLAQPQWNAYHGHDHFMIGGRITWDFRREGPGWGNNLLTLPAMQNMTTLVVEANEWDTIDAAIPYPSNFHPSSDEEIHAWQEKVRGFERKYLFSFAGGKKNNQPRLIRGHLIDQCRQSPFCELLTCDGGACFSPQPVMKLFEDSHFCLQPQGDSATRKSIFDSMMAGCIPVFFHQDSYSGYAWHLPKNQSDYSVFILENYVRAGTLSVESVLRNIPPEKVQQMRETVIKLIPNLVYADPRSRPLKKFTDAFDIAIKGVLERVSEKKRGLHQQLK